MEAAGLASSIITFIDFSYKLISGTVAIHKKGVATGPAGDPHIGTVVKDLENVTQDMTDTAAASSVAQTEPHQKELLGLVGSCNELAKKLVTILNSLERKTDDKKLWRSFQAAWKTIRNSDQIAEIKKDLDTYRLQILVRLNLMLTANDTSIAEQLDQMHQGNVRSFGETITELRAVQTSIKELKTELLVQAEQACRHVDESSPDQVDNTLADIKGQMSQVARNLEILRLRTPTDLQILEILRFDSVNDRVETIIDGEFHVFKRLLASKKFPPLRLNDQECAEAQAASVIDFWIENGDKVLHVSGKAGSGKSTLMKLVSQDADLREKLETWAGDAKLVVASFFFWLTGNPLQNSLEGLYRSILLEVLRQCPELTRHVFPEHWETISTHEGLPTPKKFRLRELQDALTRLVENFSGSSEYRFCFFIDGLDEFAGESLDHRDLAKQLRTWARSPDMKICASSRPHQEFHSTFDEHARIELHKLNGADIHRFCHQELEAENQSYLSSMQIRKLAFDVTIRASGVFLWARLVIRHLREGILHLDKYERLHDRLDQTPQNLMELFLHLFNQINPVDRARAYRLLLLLSRWDSFPLFRLIATTVSWLDDLEDAEFPFNQPFIAYTDEEIERRLRYAEPQLKLSCRGLVEIVTVSSENPYFRHHLRFLHRSVKDFLDQPGTISAMEETLGRHNDPFSDYLRVTLAVCKFAPTTHRDMKYHKSLYWHFWDACRLSHRIPRALDECESILRRYENDSLSFLPHNPDDQGNTVKHGGVEWGTGPHELSGSQDLSLIHLLASMNASPDWIVKRIKAGAYEKYSSDLCVVMSTILGIIEDPEPEVGLLKRLLDEGYDLSHRLAIYMETDNSVQVQYVPGWVAFLVELGNRCSMASTNIGDKNEAIAGLSAFDYLVRRRSGSDLHVRFEFHPCFSRDTGFETAYPPVSVTLEELIMLIAPPNMDTLLREIRNRKTWTGWAGGLARHVLGGLGLRAMDVETAPSSRGIASPLDVMRAGFEDPWSEAMKGSSEYYYAVRKIWVGDQVYEFSTMIDIRQC